MSDKRTFDTPRRVDSQLAHDASRLATFDQYRGLLFSIAYRMLSSVADAEDRPAKSSESPIEKSRFKKSKGSLTVHTLILFVHIASTLGLVAALAIEAVAWLACRNPPRTAKRAFGRGSRPNSLRLPSLLWSCCCFPGFISPPKCPDGAWHGRKSPSRHSFFSLRSALPRAERWVQSGARRAQLPTLPILPKR
jgi:hypothetical protein